MMAFFHLSRLLLYDKTTAYLKGSALKWAQGLLMEKDPSLNERFPFLTDFSEVKLQKNDLMSQARLI